MDFDFESVSGAQEHNSMAHFLTCSSAHLRMNFGFMPTCLIIIYIAILFQSLSRKD